MALSPNFEQRLYSRHRGSIQPGLSKIRAVLSAFGDPQDDFEAIHIAGTNGKGSVAYAIQAIATEHGLSTGRFTSPHLQRLNERFTIDGHDISDGDLEELFKEVEEVADRIECEQGMEITFFEMSTAVAFLYFSRNQVPLVVVETGLGGRLDSTNVINPLVSVITSVGFDHEEYLGSTLAEIAGEKAGIIKAETPVVVGKLESVASEVCRSVGASVAAPFFDASADVAVIKGSSDDTLTFSTPNGRYQDVTLPVASHVYVSNLGIALLAVEIAFERLDVVVMPDTAASAISSLVVPGRFELLSTSPELRCDVAHNTSALLALKDALSAVYPEDKVHVVVGMCQDKSLGDCMSVINDFACSVYTVPLQLERGAAPETLADLALKATPCSSLISGIASASERAMAEGGIVLVCGSVFLVGELLALDGRG